MRDGRNRWESFSAEAKGSQLFEVFKGTQLGGGRAIERERGGLAAHAGAVIGHADAAAARPPDIDRDLRRSGIETVFDEFLEDAGGPFDDFAGRDQAD